MQKYIIIELLSTRIGKLIYRIGIRLMTFTNIEVFQILLDIIAGLLSIGMGKLLIYQNEEIGY